MNYEYFLVRNLEMFGLKLLFHCPTSFNVFVIVIRAVYVAKVYLCEKMKKGGLWHFKPTARAYQN